MNHFPFPREAFFKPGKCCVHGFLALLSAVVLPVRGYACGGWFEEAPPMLPYYLDRLPAKSFGEVYLETSVKPPQMTAPDAGSVTDIADRLSTTDPKALVSDVDELLVAARLNYVNGDWCNLLHDVRDVLNSGASQTDISDYIAWRVAHADWFNVKPKDPYDYANSENPKAVNGSEKAIELEKKADDASAELRPHWLYLRGALGFRGGDRDECQKWFDRVRTEFPTSPRAEFALFMSGRCERSQSLKDWSDGINFGGMSPEERALAQKAAEDRIQEHWKNAESLFQSYLEKYPDGRLEADTYGWLGALYSRQGNKVAALKNYILQVKADEHPEIKKSALFMCEGILAGAKAGDDELFALVAENPVIALGTIYLVLNSASAPRTNEVTVETLSPPVLAKKWREIVLPKLAAAAAARQGLYKRGDWPPRYLAILAQAASAAGNQNDAIKLSDIAVGELEGSDDLLLARAIAFQRSGKSKEAIATYRILLKKFPTSQLAEGAQLKLALALADHHEAGAAVIELKKLREHVVKRSEGHYPDEIYPPGYDQLKMTDSYVSQDISDAELHQIDQLLDTLYNFAPPAELARGVFKEGTDEALKMDMRAILAERHLASENYTAAKEFMADAVFQETVAELERLTKAVNSAKNSRKKAEAMNQLGDAWAAKRGELLKAPLDNQTADRVFCSDWDQAGLRRRENGHALGYKNLDTALEDRDELRHASRWWMRAAREAPGTDFAARSRWKALSAIPAIASASDYAVLRAIETDQGKTSRELYDRLRSECPDSIEAKKYAAYWSFPTPKPQASDFPDFGKSNWEREFIAIGRLGCTALDYGAFGVSHSFSAYDHDPYYNKDSAKLDERIIALNDHSSDWDTSRLIKEIEEIRHQIRETYHSLGYAKYLNLLDDLALFLQEPNLSPEARKSYIELRLRFNGFLQPPAEILKFDEYVANGWQEQRTHQLMEDTSLKSVPDYVDFLKTAEAGNRLIEIPTKDIDKDGTPVTFTTKDYWSMERGMEAFLEKYPKSSKREAAMLIRARSAHWLMTPIYTPYELGEDNSTVPVYWRDKFDSKRLMSALDAYDREFPDKQYTPEIREWRASAAWRMHDWPKALELTIAGLVDKSHTDLQPEASLRLANIFADLANEKYRSSLIEAISQNPRAIGLLQKYLDKIGDNKDHPLRYLGGYLADELNFPHPQSGTMTDLVDF